MGSVGADEPTGRTEADTVEYRWEARDLRLAEARTLVSRWLDTHRILYLESALHLAVTELLSNGREASEPSDPVILRLHLLDDEVSVDVENLGVEFEPRFDVPDGLAPRGRGLGLVSVLANSVEVDHAAGRTRVVARFGLQDPL